jgi:hypothetical protein
VVIHPSSFFFPSCVPLLLSPSSLASAPPLLTSCFVCLVCWLFGTLCGCHPLGFTQTLSSSSECAVNLLRACIATHRLLPVFSYVPLRSAFNITFHVGFQLACDWLPLGSRHPHSLLSLFFLWFFFYFFYFTCICLFFPLLFSCIFSSVCSFYLVFFSIFVLLFPCTFFLLCFCL